MENILGNLEVFRIKKESSFVTVDKKLINDKKLSWKAKGLLVYLLSKPDGWVLFIADVVNHSSNGRDSVYSGLKELEKVGYIKRILEKSENGKFAGTTYFVFEELPPK